MQLWRYGFTIERLGKRYRLIKPLGRGGMADVCLAVDEHNNNDEVAIKVLLPDQLDEELLGRFMKEASLIAGWNHPNIIRIYGDVKWEVLDAKKGSLLPYIVMEYIRGGNLRERLTPDQPYPFPKTVSLFMQVCSAVQYAHEHGIIHRDIKPENILFRQHVDGSEDVVLSDFGMAVSLSATHYTFSHAGTPSYMAPEQLRGQAQPASDIYSLGVLLYRLCTGQLPFPSQFAQMMYPLQLPPRPSSINTALPVALDEIVLIALPSNPTQRFPSAQIFGERLQDIAASMSFQSSTPKKNESITSAPLKAVQTFPPSLKTKEVSAADKSNNMNNSLSVADNAACAQGDGTELLGMNDPRSATIGVIYVSPKNDRKSVLAAILTQEKLGRKDIVIDLPQANNAFQNAQDFKDLEKHIARKLQAKIIFITTDDAADYARQHQFAVFPTLDSYTQSLDSKTVSDKKETPERRLPFFGGKSKPLNQGAAVVGGAVAGAAAASALSNAGQGNARAVGQPANAGAAQTDIDEPDGQGVAQMSPRRGSASSAPPTSAASSSTIDDDDAIDDAPSVPVRHGSEAAGMAGAAGGLLVGETLRPGQADPMLDSAGPTPLKSAPSNTPAVSAGPPLLQDPAPLATNPSEPATGGEADGDPGIIDLRPVPRGGNRSAVDLQGSAAAAGAVQATRSIESPPSRGATRRRNGGGAVVAGMASGGLLGAAAASSAPAGAPIAASGGASEAAAAPPNGGQPSQRGTSPGRGRRGNTPPRRRRALLLLLLLLLLLAIIGGFVYSSANPGRFPSTTVWPFSKTITIVPDSKEVQDSYVMQAVTTQANADQLQVSMRNLSIAPNAQNKTVAGTGHGAHKAPAAAKGILTFINGAFSPFTVGAGTVISASNGVSVVTDLPATIPAGTPGGANGSVSVPAHAVTAGTAGNLDQGLINKICCSASGSIFVRNDAAFAGGVDAQTYMFVRQGDVDAAATPLEATLTQEASRQFKQQLKLNEKLVSDPTCNSNVLEPPGTVGDQGHNIASTTITVTAKCTGVAYDQGGAQAVAKDRLQKKANIDPGQGYSLVGNIVTSVSVSKVNPDSVSLLVNARGIWAYQFDAAQEQALARQLAGKKLTDAQAFLNAQRGINNAKIATKGDTLPTDPTQITFTIQKVPGESSNNSNP